MLDNTGHKPLYLRHSLCGLADEIQSIIRETSPDFEVDEELAFRIGTLQSEFYLIRKRIKPN